MFDEEWDGARIFCNILFRLISNSHQMHNPGESYFSSNLKPRKNRSLLFGALALMLVIGFGFVLYRMDAELTENENQLALTRIELNGLRQEYVALQAHRNSLQTERDRSQSLLEEAQHLNRKYRSQIEEARRELDHSRQGMLHSNQQMIDLNEQIDELKAQLVEARGAVPAINRELKEQYEGEIESLSRELIVLQDIIQYIKSQGQYVAPGAYVEAGVSAQLLKFDVEHGLIAFESGPKGAFFPGQEYDVSNAAGDLMHIKVARVDDQLILAHVQGTAKNANFINGQDVTLSN